VKPLFENKAIRSEGPLWCACFNGFWNQLIVQTTAKNEAVLGSVDKESEANKRRCFYIGWSITSARASMGRGVSHECQAPVPSLRTERQVMRGWIPRGTRFSFFHLHSICCLFLSFSRFGERRWVSDAVDSLESTCGKRAAISSPNRINTIHDSSSHTASC